MRRDLWDDYLEARAPEARNVLVEAYLPWARKLIKPWAKRYRLDRAELESVAAIGLMGAIDKYQPGKRGKFLVYAYAKIRGAILDWLEREQRRLPTVPLDEMPDPDSLERRGNALMDHREDFTEAVDREDQREWILSLLDNERDRELVRLRYYEERRWADVAERMGLSVDHLHALHRAVLDRLGAMGIAAIE